jgi:hypothetical protein
MKKAVPEIAEIKERAEAELMKRPGVTGVDVGFKYVGGKRTDEVVIRVMVEKKKTVPKGEMIPDTIEGVKTDVIERKYELQQASNRKKVEDVELQSDTGRYRPLKGGVSMGPCRSVGGYIYAGTLGAIVKDNSTGNHVCLSNFHVMCIDNGWHVGDQMCQPSLIDTGHCPADVIGTLLRASLGGTVDCAICTINTGIGYACDVVDIGHVAGTAAAVLNAPVRKRGRTTGLTYGFVDGINATVSIDYGDGLGVQTLTHQITVRPDTTHNPLFSDHGDSGSVIMDANRKVIGLLFAGSSDGHTLGNMISNVLSALNISMCVGGAVVKPIIQDHKLMIRDKSLVIDSKIIRDNIIKYKDVIDIPPISHGNQELDARVAQLESAVGQLTTFITGAMRPDLSQSALGQESDVTELSQEPEPTDTGC